MEGLSDLTVHPIAVEAATVRPPALSPEAPTLAGPPPDELPLDDTPRRIGRYLVLRTLGVGGMGIVYAAYDPQLDRKVAIKRLRDESSQAQARMMREALAMARLSHPNVVAVHAVDVDEHGVYITMEFVEGGSLRAWLAAQPRTTGQILAVFVQAGHGLAAAHAAGLIHRDFKPDNVLVDDAGRVRVCDFGLARAPADHDLAATDEVAALSPWARTSGILSSTMTSAGVVVGTPAYMAPEQAAGVLTDVQADIYSFCLSLYEALHGHRPSMVGAPVDPRPPGPTRKVPAWLRAVLYRGMRSDPAQRWPSIADLLAALASDPPAARRRAVRTLVGVTAIAGLAAACVLASSQLAAAWAHARAEELAAARLAVVEAQGHADAAEAAADFQAFVDDEQHRGTSSLGRAYLHRGHDLAARGDLHAAIDDFATAYTQATTPELADAALRAMARGFRSTWSSRQLGRALDVLAATSGVDAEIAGLRAEQGLLAGDLVGAAAALAEPAAASSPLQPLRPVLAALARGGPTGHVGTHPRIVDHHGAPALATCWDRRLDVHALTPKLPLLASYTAPVGLDRTLERAGWALAAESGHLYVLDLNRADPVHLRVPFAGDVYFATEADLDRDGRVDLYFGPGGGPRGFYVISDVYGDPQPPRPAHSSTHTSGADFESARLVDLDGDGREELLAGFGAWTAYDVRAFRPGGDALALTGRATLGRPVGLGEIRLADGIPRIAVATDEQYANRNLFPAAPHVAAPAAVHLLRKDPSLATEHTLPLPRRPDGSAFRLTDGVLVGDLDGDGLEDMLLGADALSPRVDLPLMFVAAQQQDATFTTTAMVGLRPRLLVELDGDPTPELIANDRDFQLWVLGVGDDPLPRPHALPPSRAAVPPELTDPMLVERWQRVEELGALGLSTGAARDLESAARLAPEPARARLLDRAAEHAVLAGDDAWTITLDERLLASPLHRVTALARSAEANVRLGRFAEAGRQVQALAAAPLPLPTAAAGTLRALSDLSSFARDDLRITLDFHEPFDESWHVALPESVRRDPHTGDLRLELVGDDVRALSIPLLWTGGPLAIEFELELEDIEWGQELRVTLVDDDGRPWIGAGTGGGGGGGTVVQTLSGIGWGQPWKRVQELPRPPAGSHRRIRVRLGVLPRTHQGFYVFEHDGRIDSDPFELLTSPPPGRYHLVFGTAEKTTAPLRLSGVVRDLEIHGALLDPGGVAHDADVPAAAARKLADGDPAAALAILSADPRSDAARSLLQGFALAELGDIGEAEARFSEVLADGDPTRVARVHAALRRGPAVALAVRAALGSEFLIAAESMWRPYIHQHAAIPEARPRVREALAGLERVQPTTPAQAQAYADLLTLRGILAASDGDPRRAEHDLTEGLHRGPSGSIAVDAMLALIRLSVDDPARAVAYTLEVLVSSPAPDAVRLRLRGDPDLADLHRDPRWAALVADPYAP